MIGRRRRQASSSSAQSLRRSPRLPRQLAAGLLGIVGAHQRLPDQHRVDADPLELLDLLARADAALGDDRLAGRHVGEQLERALEVDREVATGRGC